MRHCHCKRCGAIFPETESFDIVITLEDDDTEEDNQALLLLRVPVKFDEMAETYSFWRNLSTTKRSNHESDAKKASEKDTEKSTLQRKATIAVRH